MNSVYLLTMPGTNVKQADVVLMGYPVMVNMTEEIRGNDLHIYEQVCVLSLKHEFHISGNVTTMT